MPYSASQLGQFYSTVNRGQAPDQTTQARIPTIASQDASGAISDATTLAVITRTAQTVATTDVLLATYQFFTGSIPTSAGLDYLVNTPGSGFNTSYFNGTGAGPSGQPASATNVGAGGFNLENRYYNEAVALVTSNGATAAAFAANYGSLSISQTIQTAYSTIIGASEVGAAAAQAATTSIMGSLPYFQAIAVERAGGVDVGGQPGQNIALKAVIIGYILEEALKADVGLYARAIDNFNAATSFGTAQFNTNILTTYGVGSANDLGAAIIYSTVGSAVNNTLSDLAYRSTTANDTLTIAGANISGVTVDLSAGNDLLLGSTTNGIVAVAGTPTTLLAGDGNDTIGRPIAPLRVTGGQASGVLTLDGGAGTDTLNIQATSDINSTVTITGFETVNVQGIANVAITIQGTRISGATTLAHSGGLGLNDSVVFNGLFGNQGLAVSAIGSTAFVFGGGATNPTIALTSANVGGIQVFSVVGTTTITHTVAVTAEGFNLDTDNFTDASAAAVNIGYLTFSTFGGGFHSHTVDLSSTAGATLTMRTYASGGVSTDAIYLSAGADVLRLNFGAGLYNSTIVTGAGSDIIYIAGPSMISDVNYVDGSGGNRPSGNMTLQSGQVTTFSNITDFSKGSDHLNVELGTGVYYNTLGNAAYAGASSLAQAGAVAASLMGTGGTTVFEYGGSTYVYQDDGSGTFSTGDVLIKLSGSLGLSVGGLNTSDIHFG